MCGIFAVIYGKSLDRNFLNSQALKMKHRGPDGFGEFMGANSDYYFAHNRHTVVDITLNGNQPFTQQQPGKQITWIMNSEIYNHQEIRN